MARTFSPSPSARAQVPVASSWRSRSQAPGVSMRWLAGTRTPSRASSASRSPLVETCSARVRPSAARGTSASTASPSPVWAGTAIQSAPCAHGTAVWTPSRVHCVPSRRAVTESSAGSWPLRPWAAAVRTSVPRPDSGSRAAASSGLPWAWTAMAVAQCSSSGTRASTFAASRSTRHRAIASRPAPPCSSARTRLSRSDAASLAHSGRSKSSATAPGVSAGLGTPSGATSAKTAFAASTAACCSSVKVKSTACPPARTGSPSGPVRT